MRKIFNYAIVTWGAFWFFFLMILCYPFFIVAIARPKWRKNLFFVNRWWAKGIFKSVLLPYNVYYRVPLSSEKPYVFCANHTSYIDIPALGASAPQYLVFLGKQSLAKVPFFGYMYRKLYILLDRRSLKASYEVIEESKQTLAEGYSLAIFPEGSINRNENPVHLARFKDGAFRIAIEQQVPIVPVTLPYNRTIFHAYSLWFKRHPMDVIYHEPIETQGMTLDDLDYLKNKTFETIEKELYRYFPEGKASVSVKKERQFYSRF